MLSSVHVAMQPILIATRCQSSFGKAEVENTSVEHRIEEAS
jgi:hypothetical protein